MGGVVYLLALAVISIMIVWKFEVRGIVIAAALTGLAVAITYVLISEGFGNPNGNPRSGFPFIELGYQFSIWFLASGFVFSGVYFLKRLLTRTPLHQPLARSWLAIVVIGLFYFVGVGFFKDAIKPESACVRIGYDELSDLKSSDVKVVVKGPLFQSQSIELKEARSQDPAREFGYRYDMSWVGELKYKIRGIEVTLFGHRTFNFDLPPEAGYVLMIFNHQRQLKVFDSNNKLIATEQL